MSEFLASAKEVSPSVPASDYKSLYADLLCRRDGLISFLPRTERLAPEAGLALFPRPAGLQGGAASGRAVRTASRGGQVVRGAATPPGRTPSSAAERQQRVNVLAPGAVRGWLRQRLRKESGTRSLYTRSSSQPRAAVPASNHVIGTVAAPIRCRAPSSADGIVPGDELSAPSWCVEDRSDGLRSLLRRGSRGDRGGRGLLRLSSRLPFGCLLKRDED